MRFFTSLLLLLSFHVSAWGDPVSCSEYKYAVDSGDFENAYWLYTDAFGDIENKIIKLDVVDFFSKMETKEVQTSLLNAYLSCGDGEKLVDVILRTIK